MSDHTDAVTAHSVSLQPGAELLETWRFTVTGSVDGREIEGVIHLEWDGGTRFVYDPDEALLTSDGVDLDPAGVRRVLTLFEGSPSERKALAAVRELATRHHDSPRARALVAALDSRLRT